MRLTQEVMIGNYAIARGLVEAGLELASAYPGTPSSEILPGIIDFNKSEKRSIYAEWSINERCALEVAFGAAFAGKKTACMMKQVGLNVAFPPLLHAKEEKIKGGIVLVVCDDPGPQSSQTEQDTRLIAVLSGIPIFDPSSPSEAADIAYYALNYSFEKKIPVILRSTHRVSHARESVALYPCGERRFNINEGVLSNKKQATLGIVASGMSYSVTIDVVAELGLSKTIPVYKSLSIISNKKALKLQNLKGNSQASGIMDFVEKMDRVLVLEETDTVLELIIDNGDKILGRHNGYVPSEGELTYDVIRGLISRAAAELGITKKVFTPDNTIEETMKDIDIPQRPPKLCAGCPHRASFYALRYAFPEAIFPGDIGCYTLGISMGAVDTCIDMGGGLNLASGFFATFNQDDNQIPIIATIGDSTFFHSGLTPLYDAVKKSKRFILLIMDNGTTAMTGMQPTPQTGVTASGAQNRSILIEDIVKGFGVDFLRILDPYDLPFMIDTIKEAYRYVTSETPEKIKPAVIIARRECLLSAKGKGKPVLDSVSLERDCIGCGSCINLFECPAICFDNARNKVFIDDGLCARCGVCLFVCTMNREGKGLFKFQDNYFIKHKV